MADTRKRHSRWLIGAKGQVVGALRCAWRPIFTYLACMGTREIHQYTLMDACSAAGDEARLANALDIPVDTLVHYLLGDEPVPTYVFVKAVDLLLTRTTRHIADKRVFLEQLRRRYRL
jgi:hypothetical protein